MYEQENYEDIYVGYDKRITRELKKQALVRQLDVQDVTAYILLDLHGHITTAKKIQRFYQLSEQNLYKVICELMRLAEIDIIKVQPRYIQRVGSDECEAGYSLANDGVELVHTLEINCYSEDYVLETYKQYKKDYVRVPKLYYLSKKATHNATRYGDLSAPHTSRDNDIHDGTKQSVSEKMALGKKGEYIFEILLQQYNIPYVKDKSDHTKADSYDFVVKGLKIDVKTLGNCNPRKLNVLAHKLEKYDMDIYVAVRYFTEFEAGYNIGWISKEDLIKEGKFEKNHYGKWNKSIKTCNLNPISDLLQQLI